MNRNWVNKMETVIDKQSEIAIFGLKTSLQLEEGLFVFFL